MTNLRSAVAEFLRREARDHTTTEGANVVRIFNEVAKEYKVPRDILIREVERRDIIGAN